MELERLELQTLVGVKELSGAIKDHPQGRLWYFLTAIESEARAIG
jgi:hypothetical protein